MLNVLYRMGYKGTATGHGFRSTASTILNEMDYNPDAIERQLAHVEKNKIRAAYRGVGTVERARLIFSANDLYFSELALLTRDCNILSESL